jgi:hypothetical protein
VGMGDIVEFIFALISMVLKEILQVVDETFEIAVVCQNLHEKRVKCLRKDAVSKGVMTI